MSIDILGLSNSLGLAGQSVAVNIVKVQVKLEPNQMFEDIASAYANEIVRITRFENKENILDEDMIRKYFNTVLWLHVSNVTNSMNREYSRFRRNLVLPTVLVSVLLQIGEAVDQDFGLKFVPSYEIDSKDVLSVSELEEVSYELLRLERLGLKLTTTGLPQPKDCGTLGFMGCQLIENEEIRSYRHDHPVFGFFRSMFRSNSLTEIMGIESLRVRYGYYDHYSSLVKAFVHESERD